MKEDVVFDPEDVGVFGTLGVVFDAKDVTVSVEKFFLFRGRLGRDSLCHCVAF